MNQSDTWQYSTRVNPCVMLAYLHHFRVLVIGRWTDVGGQGGVKGNEPWARSGGEHTIGGEENDTKGEMIGMGTLPRYPTIPRPPPPL
jgi:hypothetical protein